MIAKKKKVKTVAPFSGLLNEPDRWPDSPPLAKDVSVEDLGYFMECALRTSLSSERRAIAEDVLRISDMAVRGLPVYVPRHYFDHLDEKETRWGVRKGLIRIGWDNDPDLWHDGPLPGEDKK